VSVRRAGAWLGGLAFVQVNVGAITVLSRVALPWAVFHQGLAYVLLSAAVLVVHQLALQSAQHARPLSNQVS
jgi:heme A synthase